MIDITNCAQHYGRRGVQMSAFTNASSPVSKRQSKVINVYFSSNVKSNYK